MPNEEIPEIEKPDFSLLMFWEDITYFFQQLAYFFKSMFGMNDNTEG